jgi:hypothetical protein
MGDNPFVEYGQRGRRLSLERRWLQEDTSYLDTRVNELRHRTEQGRKDALLSQKAAFLAEAPAPEMRRTAGTLSLPELPALQEKQSLAGTRPPSGARPGRRQPAAVRSLKDLQRELQESTVHDLHVGKKLSSRATSGNAMVLPLLGSVEARGRGVRLAPSRKSSLLHAFIVGVALQD